METSESHLRLPTRRLSLACKRSQAKDRQNVLPAQVSERTSRICPLEQLHAAVELPGASPEDEDLQRLQRNEVAPLAGRQVAAHIARSGAEAC